MSFLPFFSISVAFAIITIGVIRGWAIALPCDLWAFLDSARSVASIFVPSCSSSPSSLHSRRTSSRSASSTLSLSIGRESLLLTCPMRFASSILLATCFMISFVVSATSSRRSWSSDPLCSMSLLVNSLVFSSKDRGDKPSREGVVRQDDHNTALNDGHSAGDDYWVVPPGDDHLHLLVLRKVDRLLLFRDRSRRLERQPVDQRHPGRHAPDDAA